MPGDLPYMKLYCDDYLADTIDLDARESGAYLHILMHMWKEGGSLSNDPRLLARYAKLDQSEFEDVWERIKRFFTSTNGRRIQNHRLNAEYEKSKRTVEARREAGRKGGKSNGRRIQNPRQNADWSNPKREVEAHKEAGREEVEFNCLKPKGNSGSKAQAKLKQSLSKSLSKIEASHNPKITPPISPPDETAENTAQAPPSGHLLVDEILRITGRENDPNWAVKISKAISDWRNVGADDRLIVETVRAVSQRAGGRAGGPEYFTPAIKRAVAEQRQAEDREADAADNFRVEMRVFVREFSKGRPWAGGHAGPVPPDQPGCWAPPDILDEMGFQPSNSIHWQAEAAEHEHQAHSRAVGGQR